MAREGLRRLIERAAGHPLPENSCEHEEVRSKEPHECPFQTEVNDDHAFKCTCCPDCKHECLWDT